MSRISCLNTRPQGYKTWVQSQTQNKVPWLATCGHLSASSQSLGFIFSLRMNSSLKPWGQAFRQPIQTSSDGPGKCQCNETNMCDRYSCDFNWFQPKWHWNVAKTLSYPFSYTRWCMVERTFQWDNIIAAHNVFANKSTDKMIIQGCNTFLCNIMQTNQGPSKYCQVNNT